MEVETLGFHIHSKNMANFEVVSLKQFVGHKC